MKLKSNIGKLYASHLLTGMVFFYGIEKVFYETIGIDAVGIGAIGVAYLLTAILLDLPSGVLADKWSRKNVLIMSSVFLIISCVILGFSQNLIHYIIGAVVWGFYFISTSGTYEALTYDSLHEEERTKDYSKVLGYEQGFFYVGIFLASLFSGVIAEAISLRATFFISIIPALINIAVITSIKEPQYHKAISDAKLLDHLKHAGRSLRKSPFMSRLSVLLMAAIIFESIGDEYGQVFFIDLGYSALAIGILTAVWGASAALGSVIAHRIHGYNRWLLPLYTLSFTGFALSEASWGIAFFFVAVLVRNALENIAETAIQDNIESSIRATTLSALGFAGNVLTIPLMLAFGYVAREYDIFTAFQAAALLLIVFNIVIVLRGPRTQERLAT